MKGLLVLIAVLAGGRVTATTLEVPSWAALLIPFVTGGGWIVLYTARVQKRVQQATADEVYQRVAEKAGQQLEAMQAQLAEARAKAELAEETSRRIQAERDAIVQRLELRIHELEQQLETTRAEAGLDERRRK